MALSTFAEKRLFGENPKYGERFYRMWEYYLLYCAGSFRARHDQTLANRFLEARRGRRL